MMTISWIVNDVAMVMLIAVSFCLYKANECLIKMIDNLNNRVRILEDLTMGEKGDGPHEGDDEE